jgi:hypothetical protein
VRETLTFSARLSLPIDTVEVAVTDTLRRK